MAGQEQIKRDRRDDGPDDLPELGASAPAGQTHDVDDLLDEIDGVLEVQRRGVRQAVSSRRAASDRTPPRRETAASPAAYLTPGESSFTEFLSCPRAPSCCRAGGGLPAGRPSRPRTGPPSSRLTFDGGVVMAGDRRATMGNLIANRDMEKVFAADEYSVVGIAGTAGLAVELVKLYPGRVGALREDRGHD
jgi:hypothetical protein